MVYPIKILLINFFRWFYLHAVAWSILLGIYSLTAGILLQTALEAFLKTNWPLITCVVVLWCGMLIPLFLSLIPYRIPKFSFRFPIEKPYQLYLLSEFRLLRTWMTWLLVVGIGSIIIPLQPFLWILLVQLLIQVPLYRISHWRAFFRRNHPDASGALFLFSLYFSQMVQILIIWSALGIVWVFSGAGSLDLWLKAGASALGSVILAAAFSLEGDSGRPLLVNLITFSAGILIGLLCWHSSLWLILVAFFAVKMVGVVRDRVYSVENEDEDFIFS